VHNAAFVHVAEQGEGGVKTLLTACEQRQQRQQRQQECLELAIGWRLSYKAALHKCVKRCEQLLTAASTHRNAV
jgi:hypothetical protein